MSPHPVRFCNGTCTSWLWKSHMRCHHGISNNSNNNANVDDGQEGDDIPSFEGALTDK